MSLDKQQQCLAWKKITFLMCISQSQAALCDGPFLNIWLRDKYYALITRLRKCTTYYAPFCYESLLFHSDVDLYRGEEEIQKELQDKQQSKSGSAQFLKNVQCVMKCCRVVCEVVFAWASGVFLPISGCRWGPEQRVSCRGSSDLQWERMERQHHKKSAYPKGEPASFTLYCKCFFFKGHCSHMLLF